MKSAFSLRCPCWLLRVILAWAMILSPLAAVQAQQPRKPAADIERPDTAISKPKTAEPVLIAKPDAGMVDTTWLTPQSVAVAYLRPRQILTAEGAEMLPTEVLAAAGIKFIGIDPVDIETITAVAEPMLGVQPFYALVFEFAKPFTLAGLSPEFTVHAEPAQLDGKPYLKSREAAAPSLYMKDDKTLIVATEPMLRKLLKLKQEENAKTSILIDEIKDRPASDDFYLAVDTKTLRPLIAMDLGAAAAQTPPQFQKYLQAPQQIRAVEFAMNLSAPLPPLLNIHADDEAAAVRLEKLIDEGMSDIKAQMAAEMARNQTDDPIEQAAMAYSQRMTDYWLNFVRPVREEDKLAFFPVDPNRPRKGSPELQTMAVIGILVALLLPAVQAAREAARRAQSTNNLKQLVLGLLNFESANGVLPAHAIYSDDGKPLLSWRVQILPYLEEQNLYDQFHLDEPWDSEHNKKLIAKMPQVFACPSSRLDRSEGKTTYVAPVGEGLIFDGTKNGTGIRNITDGTSNTLELIEVGDDSAVIWTKPDDWQYDEKNPLKGLAGHHPGIFNAAFADGSVQAMSLDIDLDTLRALFTKSGGEVVNR